ncbi:uncharacterized protein LOC135073168 isoform X2 [Ostrinia nubilalis]|uniref:uncharacterized protein LOC135073168 isoform X2 n=1 Tax=Ostrinia nubilalis TaxID=29057 RepID=UPI0030822E2F
MVNGNYVLYGDRPSSESEIVDDHVHAKTAERKNRRKAHRTANELQSTLNMAQLDNETDSIKYEKRIKEPMLLRYVPTTDVEEHYVSDKFETYDLKPANEERPRRYAFTKKPKNPADGSVNYAYSRSSSSCSSPNGNLPTISEHAEQYGTYRVRPVPSPTVEDIMSGYESKLDKYFSKPREVKKFAAKVSYNGSHPDSLYRVSAGSGVGAGKLARALRIMRWPAALILVCVALAVFVYFLMPDNIEAGLDGANGTTYWEQVSAGAGAQIRRLPPKKEQIPDSKGKAVLPQMPGTKTSEIDFYDADTDKNYDIASVIDSVIETNANRKLPIQPVFPAHITPEVQYGNERVDSEKLRTPKTLDESNTLPDDSTLKPHITQKPEKPLAVYFKDGNGITITASTETIAKAETLNDFTNYGEKYTTKNVEEPSIKPHVPIYKEHLVPQTHKVKMVPQVYEKPHDIPPEIQEFFYRRPTNVDVNFTSDILYDPGHAASPEVPQCRSTRLALCRGILPYDLAGPAAHVNGVEITSLLSQIEFLVSTNCSERVQHFMCALLEPECSPPPYPVKMPCYSLCKAISDSCDGLIPRELTAALNCNQYSSSNCVAAKSPCYPRELPCGDGTCIPRDWICDGAADCPAGEDEDRCVTCEANEFKCPSGGCILKRWMCDGYTDCPGGEDEAQGVCEALGVQTGGGNHAAARSEPGEESAGSAPAPAVRKPFRIPPGRAKDRSDVESSKELLVTSDSSNALKRNFTRRPSLSRLTPYTRPKVSFVRPPENPEEEKPETTRKPQYGRKVVEKKQKTESAEDVNIGDLGFFDDIDKGDEKKRDEGTRKAPANEPAAIKAEPELTHLDKTISKLEKVIDGAALLRKAAQQDPPDSPETNGTTIDKEDDYSPPQSGPSGLSDSNGPGVPGGSGAPGGMSSMSSHASPCPSGELRCVDGRCITLAQLCDGTIDCFDHADEDNCYT